MRVQAVWHRYFLFSSLAMLALVGSAGGWLAAIILGLWLTPPVVTDEPARAAKVENATRRPLDDYQIILDRNIFDSAAPGRGVLAEVAPAAVDAAAAAAAEAQPASPKGRQDLKLIGTVTAGPDSLAVISNGRETGVYRLGNEIDGAILEEIARNHVLLRYRDGSSVSLLVDAEPGASAPAAPQEDRKAVPGTAGADIKKVGENSWIIPRETAERARGNINDLLRQARLEPRNIGGQTRGFVVTMIRPESFLRMLGLTLKDVVMEINNVELNSPERALQILQQLREARHISVSLLRDNQPMTFEYEID